ncbi:hypothetical protein B0J11DRAFT_326347 [Dendryphion nanum]|uniref:Uncharacterized protein n=1 Tax=Dendryphion nanum TaxID=256645 RepID=A0A9P9DRH5_9PLEO|nr:hypothetical protein B0J11DRAFT_326347 [Dendryphion nanum]
MLPACFQRSRRRLRNLGREFAQEQRAEGRTKRGPPPLTADHFSPHPCAPGLLDLRARSGTRRDRTALVNPRWEEPRTWDPAASRMVDCSSVPKGARLCPVLLREHPITICRQAASKTLPDIRAPDRTPKQQVSTCPGKVLRVRACADAGFMAPRDIPHTTTSAKNSDMTMLHTAALEHLIASCYSPKSKTFQGTQFAGQINTVLTISPDLAGHGLNIVLINIYRTVSSRAVVE